MITSKLGVVFGWTLYSTRLILQAAFPEFGILKHVVACDVYLLYQHFSFEILTTRCRPVGVFQWDLACCGMLVNMFRYSVVSPMGS